MKSASATGVACMFIINNKYFLSILRAFKLYDLLTRHMAADSRVVVIVVVAFVTAAAAVRTCHVSEMIIYLSLQSNGKNKERKEEEEKHTLRSLLFPFAPMAYA